MPLATERGGAERALRDLLELSVDQGISWLVIFLEDGPMVDAVAGSGVDTAVVPARRFRQIGRTVSAVWRVAELVRRHGSEVVLSWMTKGQLYGGPASALAGVPGTWYQVGIPSRRSWLERFATVLPARRVLACSATGAAAQAEMRPRRPVGFVYPGVALDGFDPGSLPPPRQARRLLGLAPEGPLIGTVGRLQRWKGMHVLVEAMPSILEAHPDVRCVVVGERHEREPEHLSFLEERVARLGLQEHVQLLVQRSSPLWLQAMDVVVHVSHDEPFGIVVVEAMALGKPVVAGDAGGPAELITDGQSGLLVPYGDPAALAGAVLRFLAEPELVRRAGIAARARAEEFSVERFVVAFTTALKELAGGARG